MLFAIHGALVMLALSFAYVIAAGTAWFDGLFLGIKAAVLAIVVQAVLRVSGLALKGPSQAALAIATFVLAFKLKLGTLPLLAICATAGLVATQVSALMP